MLDIRRKIGQLMVFGFNGKTATPEIKQLIRDHGVGGIILFGRNIGSPDEVLQLTAELQREAKEAGHEHPLLICTDQENGAVRRLGEGATVFPGAMLLGAAGMPEYAYKVGKASGTELKALGINWNLSPVLDVNNNAFNPVIGVRSFGENPDSVTELGRQLMKGMQAAGMITTLKHFPGHGDTSVDSHLDLPIINHDFTRLMELELKPFQASIDSGADTVMTAHVYFPAIETEDGVPATLSSKVIQGLLRERLGFNGVVTTDCMEMKAISDKIGTPKGAVAALKAGADLIMVSHSIEPQKETLLAMEEAVQSGELDEELLNQALVRVHALKEKYLTWEGTPLSKNIKAPETVGCREHRELAEEVYRRGVTIVKNEGGVLPLSPNSKVLLVYPENNSTMVVEDKRYSTFSLGSSMMKQDPSVDVIQLSNPPTDAEIQDVLGRAHEYSVIVAATLSAAPGSGQVKLVEKLHKNGSKVAVVATRSPYDLAYFADIPAYICTYEFTEPALETAAKALYGACEATGSLPVTIPVYVK